MIPCEDKKGDKGAKRYFKALSLRKIHIEVLN